jgi:hypothetical protein
MYFPEPVLFEIPVRPRIRKYIAVKLQGADGRPQPLLVTPDAQGAGLMLWAMAQSEKVMLQTGWRRGAAGKNFLQDGSGRIIAPLDMTERLGLGISEFHKSRHQYLLNHAELEVFSQFVDYIILNEMVSFCQEDQTSPPLLRIKQFTDRYDFSEDDLNEGSLRVAYWRFRKGLAATNFDVRITQLQHFVAYDRVA